MNVHFLELFYFVARHGGISAAARHIPYGIQQPAVSSQMGRLEQDLGVRLFERVPFRLTPAGEILYAHIAPFFDRMDEVARDVREADEPALTVGAAELILRDHLPLVLNEVRRKFPRLRVNLKSLGFQSEADTMLRKGQLDLAFVPLGARPPVGLRHQPMTRLPLVLQVHPRSGIGSISELFAAKRLSLPLIGLPVTSSISRVFQQGLKKRGVVWPQTIEAGSLDLVTRWVANGDGAGINIQINPGRRIPGVRQLALADFGQVTVGAVWQRNLSLQGKALIEFVHDYARRTWPERAIG